MTWQDDAWAIYEDLGTPTLLPVVHKIKPLDLKPVSDGLIMPHVGVLQAAIIDIHRAINARLAELPEPPEGYQWVAEFTDDRMVDMARINDETWEITWHPRLRAIQRRRE